MIYYRIFKDEYFDMRLVKTVNNKLEFSPSFLLLFFGYYFLVLFAVMLSRGSYIPAHTAESLYLGLEMQWGYAKHPPLHAVIPYLFWRFSGYSYYSVYFFTAGLLTSGIITSYFLSKKFLNKEKSIIATLIFSGILAINFMQLKINANTILFPLYPLIILFFYNAIKSQKLCYWLLFGVFSALGMLGKYSTIVLLFCCFLISIFTQEGRNSYKKPGIYSGFLFFIIVFGPHLLWLFYHYKPSFSYFLNATLKTHNIPIQLYLGILGTTLISILYWFLFTNNWKRPFTKVRMDFHTKFLLMSCIAPLLLIMMLPILGINTKMNWTSAFYFGIGIVLVYFSNIDLSNELKIKRGILWVFCVYTTIGFLCIFSITMSGYNNKYQLNRVSQFVYSHWHDKFNTNPSYMCHSGDVEAIAAIKLMHDIYLKTKQPHEIHLILNCDFDKRPEIDLKDVVAKGLITFTNHDASKAKHIFGAEPIFSQTLWVKKYPKLKSSKKVLLNVKFYALG